MTATPPIQTVDQAGWDCKACGACCRDFALGPVRPSIIQGLHDLRIGEDHAPAAAGFAIQRPGPDGAPAWYLTRRHDGACIFLLEDDRCAVHALHGPQAKPTFCQEYPFQAVRSADTIAVTVRQGCCGAWRSFDAGTPLPEQVQEILELDRAYVIGQFNMPSVPVLPAVAVSPSDWLWLEGRILEELQPGEPEDVIASVRQMLFTALRRQPPTPDPYRADAATQHLVTSIHRTVGAAADSIPADNAETRGMQSFLAKTHAVLDRAMPNLPGDQQVHERTQTYLDVVLRSQLLSKAFQPVGSVPAWLGLYLLGTRIARAHTKHDGPPLPKDVGPPLSTWIRFTRHRVAQQMLADLQPALIDLFLYAE